MTKQNSSCLLQAIASLIGGIIFYYVMKYVVWWVPSLAEILEYVQKPLKESISWRIIGLLIAICISISLYQLKKRLIVIFGMVEIVGGSWTIWETFKQSFETNILYALALGGGIFLLANGLENVMKKNEKNQIEKTD
jgi:arginine exporter protein ArgO